MKNPSADALADIKTYLSRKAWDLLCNSITKAHRSIARTGSACRQEVFLKEFDKYVRSIGDLVTTAIRLYVEALGKSVGADTIVASNPVELVKEKVTDALITPTIEGVRDWVIHACEGFLWPKAATSLLAEETEIEELSKNWKIPKWLERSKFVKRRPEAQNATAYVVKKLAKRAELRLKHGLPADELLLVNAQLLGIQSMSAVNQSEVAGLKTARLRYAERSNRMMDEIRRVKNMYGSNGYSMAEIRRSTEKFSIWTELVPHLTQEDRDTFMHPPQWGPVVGYAKRLLAKHHGISPATMNDWIKDFRKLSKKHLNASSRRTHS